MAYVVTPEGRVADLRVLESTDPRLTAAMTEEIMAQCFSPARYRGAPVPVFG